MLLAAPSVGSLMFLVTTTVGVLILIVVATRGTLLIILTSAKGILELSPSGCQAYQKRNYERQGLDAVHGPLEVVTELLERFKRSYKAPKKPSPGETRSATDSWISGDRWLNFGFTSTSRVGL